MPPWNLELHANIKFLDQLTIICSFKRPEDSDRILRLSLWSVKGALINLQALDPKLMLKEIDFSKISIWV